MVEEQKKLTTKEQRFVEEYCKDCNATQAAVRAKYSQKSARAIGYENLTKPYIREAIDQRLKSLGMEAAEVTKLITDIAKGDVKNYYTIKEVEEPTRMRVPLVQVIDKIKEEINFEEEYAERAGIEDKELESHQKQQAARRRKIIRHQMELERNPLATGFIEGPVQKVKHTQLDMVKLIEDKEAGRIKSITPGEFGLKVELYPADAALEKLARMHGLFEKDNEQTKATAVVQVEARILPSEAKIASSEKDVDV